MQTILNVKALNSRKEIFCPESESTSFIKKHLPKILRKSNSFIYYIHLVNSCHYF